MRTRAPAPAAAGVVAAGALPDGPKVNVGSGPVVAAAWISIDGSWQARLAGHRWLARAALRLFGIEIGHWPQGIRCRSVSRGLGFEDESIAVVYASHLLEHLYRQEALRFLRDVRRALVPGGVCRIVVPDVAAIVGWYLAHQREPAEQRKQPSSDLLMRLLLLRPDRPRGTGIVALLRQWADLHDHKWMYDQEGLLALVAEAGFADVSARGYLESVIPRDILAQVERADRLCGGAGVCVEART
jgi:predicted SAM-dependent methyltransferase